MRAPGCMVATKGGEMTGSTRALVIIGLLVAVAGGYLWGRTDEREGRTEPLTSEASAAEEQLDVYYPGTEELAPDEMRVVALGTGMPSARPKQAAACWLVELGNGDKFLFDIGSGSPRTNRCSEDSVRLSRQGVHRALACGSLRRPADILVGRHGTMNRLVPLRDLGPEWFRSRSYGTASTAMEKMQEMYAMGHRHTFRCHRLPWWRSSRSTSFLSTRSTK